MIIASAVDGNRLSMNIGRDATHHVMAGGHDGNRLFDGINVRKGAAQFTDAGQTGFKYLLAEMIQLQFHMIPFFTAAATFEDLQHHRASNNITTRQIFRVGRIALHKALAIFVDQVATLTATPFGDKRAGTINAGRMKLPHLHILHRNAGSQPHADTVAGVDVRVGG